MLEKGEKDKRMGTEEPEENGDGQEFNQNFLSEIYNCRSMFMEEFMDEN